MLGINKAKGAGLRSTYKLHPFFGHSWHVKLRPSNEYKHLDNEAKKINWATHYFPSPPSAHNKNIFGLSLLFSRTLHGKPSFEMIGKIEPEKIINELIEALDILRKSPTVAFKFESPDWTIAGKAREKISEETFDEYKRKLLHPDFSNLSKIELTEILSYKPNENTKLLTHGDWCMPNVLLSDNGNMAGIIDLGDMHVGDADLDPAIMSWAIRANMGKKWEEQYLNFYGYKPDSPAIKYHRLVYDLGLRHDKPWCWLESNKLFERRNRLKVAEAKK